MNCRLDNEVTPAYYLYVATVRQVVPATCIDPQGLPFDCSRVEPRPPIVFRQVSDPGSRVDASSSFYPLSDPDSLPTPPLGGVTAWPWETPISACNIVDR